VATRGGPRGQKGTALTSAVGDSSPSGPPHDTINGLELYGGVGDEKLSTVVKRQRITVLNASPASIGAARETQRRMLGFGSHEVSDFGLAAPVETVDVILHHAVGLGYAFVLAQMLQPGFHQEGLPDYRPPSVTEQDLDMRRG
jgi:hypothetical protein